MRIRSIIYLTVITLVCNPVYTAHAIISDSPYTEFYAANDISWFHKDARTCFTSSSNSISTNTPAKNLEDFVKKYVQYAVETGKKYNLPYEAILAQASLESGMGKSTLTTKYNNFFGIKAGSSWKGPVANMNTQEDTGDGSMITISAAFRAYSTPQEGFDGYGQFITGNSRYNQALEYPGDPYSYIKEIKAAGYATDSLYVSKVSSIITNIMKIVADNKLAEPSSKLTPTPVADITSSTNTSETNMSGGTNTSCSSSSDIPLSGSNMDKIIQVAKAEQKKNVQEYDANTLKYTDRNREAWCADFVSWVYKTAGSPFTGGSSGGWRHASVLELQSWIKKNGTYFDVGSGSPQPGDIAFYIGSQTPDGGSSQHVNLVIAVNGSTMTTIGGNQSNRVTIGDRKIALGVDSLVGFGRLK